MSNLEIVKLNNDSQDDIIDAGDGTELESTDSTESLMDKPFDPTLIKVETKIQSLDSLIKRIDRGSIQMNTESYFQRRDDLWDRTKQSRLIESILIRFPLPAFFFDASDDNKWLVVDGLQRLSSIRNFAVLKSLSLYKMEFLTRLNGSKWDELTIDLQRSIEETQVVIHKIMPGTPTDVKFNIFKRINTGGLILESQEIRHALFQGRPATFVLELAQTNEFKTATGNSISSIRMLDREFTTRFLSFYLLGVEKYGIKKYGKDIDTFMSKAMAEINSKSEIELDSIKKAFQSAMKLANSIFQDEAFRKITEGYKRKPPINKALFDSISTQFALLDTISSDILLKNSEKFKKKLKQELSFNEEFFRSVSSGTGDKKKVNFRHNFIKKLIIETISNK